MNISKKDQKMLIILAVFLLAMGYFEFIFFPLFNLSQKYNNKLIKKRKQLIVLKTKLAGLDEYRRNYRKLLKIIKVADKNSLMPYEDAPLNNKIKEIMKAASENSVKIKSIKPMNYIKEGEDGKPEVVRDKYFTIEGETTVYRFLNFARKLWGTELERVNISTIDKTGNRLRYFIKIEFLEKINLDLSDLKDIDAKKYKIFELKHNPFSIIKPPPPPRPKSKATHKPKGPPRIVHRITGYELIGIAHSGKKDIAIIKDTKKNKVVYLVEGDHFRESIVRSIKAKSVIFYFADNKQKIVAKLKKSDLKLSPNTQNRKNEKKGKRKGHLGIMVETFTRDLANRYHVEFNPGLFVISPGKHKDIFKKHDIILEINGQPVPNFEAALRVMNQIYSGDKINIVLKRNGKKMNLTYKAD
ncbi:MAG: PDZ domain-containing protein [Victivallales bacterium]|nr:PDZ domain-containing protein [Victivallales bacterium]MCF7888768.1 PDZ domain-containing protein [Victivallales bacterium]